ncbi:hypothetical protein RND71_006377 [Anisodus tanguticus]|uniref:Fe2OG dioxygenase domain-containing protein n=1 Tax=Anisodus tanguticus TaxID=243964 RepID=A0AAE1VW55_9SOLA|nr:hypothetical protein RND71_006377 [Anisodus tanguticus]
MRMLDYICEGLGLKLGYFDNELSQIQMMLTNYYPPCPDPSSTLGSGGHYDGNLITLLQQDLPGLQQLIVKDGNWIAVEPIPTAFVINLGLTLKNYYFCRGVAAKYSVEARKLTMRMLDYIFEGLGLKLGYFDNELSQIQMMLTNYYAPCPHPSSTLGSGGHYDGNLITLLQQDLPGLQQLIVKDDNWIAVVAKYSVEARKLTMRMLDYICEGLGLKLGYFDNELSQIQMMLTNYYPPCPDPSSTLGSGGHYDGNLITLLQQDLPGLQQLIVKDGNWIAVEPIPTAFVINLGLTLKMMLTNYYPPCLDPSSTLGSGGHYDGNLITLLQQDLPGLQQLIVKDDNWIAVKPIPAAFVVITNEKFEGSIHRVVTDPTRDRVSIATLIGPDYSCTIEPAKELLSQDNPPLYKPYPYAEFVEIYLSDKSDYVAGVKPYKINA